MNISSYSLGATHLIIMVHNQLAPIISDIKSDCVVTGTANIVGNKGGVGVSFKIGRTSLLCISSHLAAGHSQIEKRNADWRKIHHQLVLQKKEDTLAKNIVAVDPDSNIDCPFDAVIWLGDFNYRINGIIGAITHAMTRNMYEVLIAND